MIVKDILEKLLYLSAKRHNSQQTLGPSRGSFVLNDIDENFIQYRR
jgi:hypothetical protein